MKGRHGLIEDQIRELRQGRELDELAQRLQPDGSPPARRLATSAKVNADRALKFWQKMPAGDDIRDRLLDPVTLAEIESYQGNIENCIGAVRVPVGVVGPLRINGLAAKGDYHVPLATTEAAMVASYHRGAMLLSAVGGCSAMVLYESVNRAPALAFTNLAEAARFVVWITEQFPALQDIAAGTTRHGRLIDMSPIVEGNHVYLDFDFRTADASGQNMVTIATEAICQHIREHSPVRPQRLFVEGNVSGDKKASARAFGKVRGKKVTADVRLPAEVVQRYLHTDTARLCDYWQMSAVGGVLSGTMGVQGHFANGLAALYLATGQDVACVAESAVGITRFDRNDDGSLYAAVTLPGIMLGTVGGGTGLPSQQACLSLLGLNGAGCSRALAEVCAGLLLGGELSIIGAMAAGEFSRAHHKLARTRVPAPPPAGEEG